MNGNSKFEIRNSKPESRSGARLRDARAGRAKYFGFRISDFGFLLLFLLLVPPLAQAASAAASSTAPWALLSHRSVSRSQQFIVYAEDANARANIAMAAEDAKEKLLKLLGANDNWRRPIVILLRTADTADPNEPPSNVRIIDTADGFKVEFNIVLGDDPRQAHFPQQLMRALLLEYAYRTQPALVSAGATYTDPPAWLVDGFANLAADPDPEANSDLFRSLMENGKTPTLADFLAENPASIDDTPSRRLYSACAMSLVRLLLDLPDGGICMQAFIRHWPGPNDDPEAELLNAFPVLHASGGESLDKWWSLGLASLSAADRYQGLSLDDTSRQLDALLTFDVAMDKTGKTKSFTLDQYAKFRNAPGAADALNTLSIRLVGLEAQGSPMMREVMAGYEAVAVELLRHHSTHLQAHLNALADYRRQLAKRMDDIADYLNWYEATQRTEASGSFDEYVRTADDLDGSAPTRNDPITKYMDSVEQQLSQ